MMEEAPTPHELKTKQDWEANERQDNTAIAIGDVVEVSEVLCILFQHETCKQT